jgi:hypothetical protein
MKVSPRGAPAAGRERLLKTAVYEVAGTVNFAAEKRLYCRALLPNAKEF